MGGHIVALLYFSLLMFKPDYKHNQFPAITLGLCTVICQWKSCQLVQKKYTKNFHL